MNNLIFGGKLYYFLGLYIIPQGYCIAATSLSPEGETRYLTHLNLGIMKFSEIKKDLSKIIEDLFIPPDKFIETIEERINVEKSPNIINKITPFRKNLKDAISNLGIVRMEHIFYIISNIPINEIPGDINVSKPPGQTFYVKFELPLAIPIQSLCYTASFINDEKLNIEPNITEDTVKRIKNELSSIHSNEDVEKLSRELMAINYAIGEIEYRKQTNNLEFPFTTIDSIRRAEGWRSLSNLFRAMYYQQYGLPFF